MRRRARVVLCYVVIGPGWVRMGIRWRNGKASLAGKRRETAARSDEPKLLPALVGAAGAGSGGELVRGSKHALV